jgi:nicotinate-nucleotide adenylyltransferase
MARDVSARRRVAFYGGSFNPVHRGHLYVARRALRGFDLDEIRFLPARTPPHKTAQQMLPAELRIELLHLATHRHPCFVVDDFEIRHPELRYTFDTLAALESLYPDARPLRFLIGGDSLRDLPKWHRAAELVRRYEFLTVPRDPNVDLETLLAPAAAAFPEEDVARLRAGVLPVPPREISSTAIRAASDLASVRKLLPRAVAARLAELGLLGAGFPT